MKGCDNMSHQVIWTKRTLELFIEYANLTEEEEKVMRTRAQAWTRTKQCRELGMSTSTLDRIIKRLKSKYDAVQKEHPDELPERRFSAKETYLDTH